jgi:hypothetical protein
MAIQLADDTSSQVRQWYHQYLGRDPSQSELNDWAQTGNLGAIKAGIAGSQEAQQYGSQQQQLGQWGGTPYEQGGITGWGGGGYGSNFDEGALEQAWLASGGRTPGDLAAFFQQNPQLVAGAELVGSKKDKIRLPNGQVVDAVLASGEGGRGAQWLRETSGGGGSGGSSGGSAPNSTPFEFDPFVSPEAFSYADYDAPDAFTGPQWQAPTGVDDSNDPGYTARLKEGERALQRSAAAKGTLLTGGTLADLAKFGQEYAANEYQNVYNRAYQNYDTNYKRAASEYDRAAQAGFQEYATNRANQFQNYQTNYENALNAYRTNFETEFKPWEANYNQAYQSWWGNQQAGNMAFQNQLAQENQRFNQLFQTTQLGLGATGQQAQYGAGYANNAGNIYGNYGQNYNDLITGQGNANAAGQVGSSNAWGQAFGNMANLGTAYAGMYGQQPQQQGAGVGRWYTTF